MQPIVLTPESLSSILRIIKLDLGAPTCLLIRGVRRLQPFTPCALAPAAGLLLWTFSTEHLAAMAPIEELRAMVDDAIVAMGPALNGRRAAIGAESTVKGFRTGQLHKDDQSHRKRL